MVSSVSISAVFRTKFGALFFSARAFSYSFFLSAHFVHLIFLGTAGWW